MFIHVFDKKTFEEFKSRGAIPLKKDSVPFIMLIEEDTKMSFEDISKDYYEISETMYFD